MTFTTPPSSGRKWRRRDGSTSGQPGSNGGAWVINSFVQRLDEVGVLQVLREGEAEMFRPRRYTVPHGPEVTYNMGGARN